MERCNVSTTTINSASELLKSLPPLPQLRLQLLLVCRSSDGPTISSEESRRDHCRLVHHESNSAFLVLHTLVLPALLKSSAASDRLILHASLANDLALVVGSWVAARLCAGTRGRVPCSALPCDDVRTCLVLVFGSLLHCCSATLHTQSSLRRGTRVLCVSHRCDTLSRVTYHQSASLCCACVTCWTVVEHLWCSGMWCIIFIHLQDMLQNSALDHRKFPP